jgi:hypothetical protein
MPRSLSAHGRLACLLAGVLLAPAAVADDAARISRLETEIQQLRSQLDQQNRRIQRLEAELPRHSGVPLAVPQSKPRAGDARSDAPAPAGRQAWHAAAAWERVRPGMSEAEVTAILGEPSAADSVGVLKSLFYRDATRSGHVNFKDGRVVAVGKPSF